MAKPLRAIPTPRAGARWFQIRHLQDDSQGGCYAVERRFCAVKACRAEVNRLALQLPEYDAIMEMYGVDPSVGLPLMTEIGNIRRFTHRKSLVSFAGTDPETDELCSL